MEQNKVPAAAPSPAKFDQSGQETTRAPFTEDEGTKSETSELENEVAELKKKRQDLLRMLSPSYDVRKQWGETSEDAVIANKVVKEYYAYFQDTLYSATRSMGAGPEKETFRRQTCLLFQTAYGYCQEEMLDVMTSELKEVTQEVSQADDLLSERQFDRQRAFGLLFRNVNRHDFISEETTFKEKQDPAIQHDCLTTIEQPAARHENNSLHDEKFKLQQEIEELKTKQAELLRMYMGTIPLEKMMDWIQTIGEKEIVDNMKKELWKLTSLPEEVSRSGKMTESNEREYYTRQQAYGLLLSSCNPQLTSETAQKISSEVLLKLNLTAELVFQNQAEHAVQLAWRMLTCVPPLVVCQPVKYSQEWHKPMPAHWTSLSGQFDLVYYQPVLLSSPSGPVKEKGQVGRVESEDPENCVNIEEEQDSSSEQEDCIHHPEDKAAQQLLPDPEQKNQLTPLPVTDKAVANSSSKCCAIV